MRNWQFTGNSYLRLLSSLRNEPKKRMTISMQSVSELQSALEAIQNLEKVMSYTKANLECLTTIKLAVKGSKEMFS